MCRQNNNERITKQHLGTANTSSLPLSTYSHQGTIVPSLLALFQIAFLSFHPHILPQWNALHFNELLTRLMPPPQFLLQTTIFFIGANAPLASTDFNNTSIFREMEFWQEELCWCIFCRCFICVKMEFKDAVSKVESGA